MKYVKGLDTLRALAVLMVIHNHWGFSTIKSSAFLTFILTRVLPTGSFAVDFFFVLSGFLITNILIKAKKNSIGESKTSILKNFIARRCLRIFPIYYICIFVLFILNYPSLRDHFVYLFTYTENFLVFKQGGWDTFSHTWSLAVEEQFYLIWPLVILFVPDKYLVSVMLFFVFAGTILGFITVSRYGFYANVLPFNCFNAFAIGGLSSYILDANNRVGQLFKKTLLYLLPLAIILYILLEWNFIYFPGRIVNAVISVNVIIYVIEAKYGRFFSAFINNNLLSKMGRMSYGIYLFHYCIPYYYNAVLAYFGSRFIFEHHINRLLHQPFFAETVQFIFLILISYLSYHFIETRFLKLKSKFVYGSDERPLLVSKA
jgi:peptidoglycan/LPS O-acetylase OafA/YrhL